MKTFKRILASLMVAVMVLTAAPLSGFVGLELPNLFNLFASAATYSGTCGGNVKWSYDTSTYTLTISGAGAMYDYRYNNRPWESYENSIKTVVIGNDVTTIGDHAFYSCDRLTSITIPDSVTSIGTYVFYNCTGLTSVTIPDSITNIGDNAFYNCSGIIELTMPISAKIYNSSNTFYNCYNIEKITFTKGDGTVQKYYDYSNGSDTFYKYTPWYISRWAEVIIEDGVTAIGDYMFHYSELKTITLPNSVKSIGVSAFDECHNLTSIIIPDGVVSIGKEAFHSCWSLKNIIVPDSVTSIGDYAFDGCSRLASIEIGNGITSIGLAVFSDCISLTNISIPSNIKSIGVVAFQNCASLECITIPDSVTNIGEYAFERCTSLTSIMVDTDNQYYSSDSFGVLYNKNKTQLIEYPVGNERSNYVIPDGVTSIGSYAFYGCTGLTNITIPDSVKSIGLSAFSSCQNLTNIYYRGCAVDFAEISINSYNESLFNAVWHYNSCIESEKHDFVNGECVICKDITNLPSSIKSVTYVQQEDSHKTFNVICNGRASMIQFIEPDGGTRTYDRYNKNVKITGYNINGEIVNSMNRDLSYEVWEIYTNLSVGTIVKLRAKFGSVWEIDKLTLFVDEYNPVISMKLDSYIGDNGSIPATVVADKKTEKVMFKMTDGTSVTVSDFIIDENDNRVFRGSAWMNEEGLNEIKVYIRRNNTWKLVGILEYIVE